jgi:choline dehydrogenase
VLTNFAFRGHWPLTAENGMPADPPGLVGFSLVKANVQSNAGTVRLASTDPRDPPEIVFKTFEGTQGEIDIDAMADAVAWARSVFANVDSPVGPVDPAEPPCPGGDSAACRAGDKDFIKKQVFGHHATSTCAIGADNDPLAVLDSKFRVRGVDGLRVVDGSAFPRTPGTFPIVATFLLSEKASLDVLADA